MTANRRRFMKLAGLTAIGGATGSASGRLAQLPGDPTLKQSSSGDGKSTLQKPIRADEPTQPVQELLADLAEHNVPHLYQLTTKEARDLYEKFFISPVEEEVGKVKTMEVPGPNGKIPIRVYWPKESRFNEPLPVSIYMHGGGWVLGGLDTHDSVARSLTNASEAIVVSIDYRKGPEHPFPAPVEDCWAATEWVAKHADSIGADASRMAVTGESAGGDMAAVLTLLAQHSQMVEFVYQFLIYPATDLSGTWRGELPETFSILNPKQKQQLDRRYLVPKDFPWFLKRYLPFSYAKYNLYTSPLLAPMELLKNTPPATIVPTGFGPLGDQDYLYAKRLQAAGVPVEFTNYEGMIHDFFNMEHLTDPFPDIPTAGDAKRKAGETLREAFSENREPGC